jgi:3-dehydroquinate synthase
MLTAVPIRIDVHSERATYPVVIGPRLTSQAAGIFRSEGLDSDCVVVSCAPVWRLQGKRLRGLGRGRPPVLIADGERAKTLATVSRLYDEFVRRGLDRSGTIVAYGGGVVGDVTGFAAATFLRGVKFVQVPTTLLAQVDSAVGGKVGVNLPAGKNLAGAFHPPRLVLCDPDVLSSLPRREFRAGLYEVVKYGIIASRPLFDRVASSLDAIFAHQPETLLAIISDCCRIKADVVSRDERESGPRRVLNFGHTVGHALEAITNYRRFRHGEAIAYGILAASHLSHSRGALSDEDLSRVKLLIQQLGPLPSVTDLRSRDALTAIGHDKKVVAGSLHFVLAHGLGATTIVSDVTTAELRAAMKAIGLRS